MLGVPFENLNEEFRLGIVLIQNNDKAPHGHGLITTLCLLANRTAALQSNM
jgi:hypothetical protein